MANLSAFRGDTTIFGLSVFGPNASVFNLTGCKLWFTAKRSTSDSDNQAVFSLDSEGNGIVISTPLLGTATIEVVPANTSSLASAANLVYDIQLRDAAGRVFTIGSGTIAIVEDVTRSTL